MCTFIRFRNLFYHKCLTNSLLVLAVMGTVQQPLYAAASEQFNKKARNYLHMAYVQGEGDVQGVKLAVQRESEFFKNYLKSLGFFGTISIEVSTNFWCFGPKKDIDQNFVFALSPVITFPLGHLFKNEVLAEFGIGLSLLDDTTIAGKNVSTHYQFEDRLGFIYQLSKGHSVTLRYLHYSNAGFKKPNPGLDFISLGYSHAF